MTDNTNLDLRGKTPESWRCVDCGVNTFPGSLSRIEMERAFAAQNGCASWPPPTLAFPPSGAVSSTTMVAIARRQN